MYFDFDERYTDYQPVGGAIRRWDGVLVSVGVHVVIVLAILFAPMLPIFAPEESSGEARLVPPPERERERFVFVQPATRSRSRTTA